MRPRTVVAWLVGIAAFTFVMLLACSASGARATNGVGLGMHAADSAPALNCLPRPSFSCTTVTGSNCIFLDDFTADFAEAGANGVNPCYWTTWTQNDGGAVLATNALLGNFQNTCYTSANVILASDGLHLRAQVAPGVGCPLPNQSTPQDAGWTSGAIAWRGDGGPTAPPLDITPPYTLCFDAIETSGNGYWPIGWSVSDDCQNPNFLTQTGACGAGGTRAQEIDMSEGFSATGGNLDFAFHDFITSQNFSINYSITNGVQQTFCTVVTANSIKQYINGGLVSGSLGVGPDGGMGVIFGVQLGTSAGVLPDAAMSPQDMVVKKVYGSTP